MLKLYKGKKDVRINVRSTFTKDDQECVSSKSGTTGKLASVPGLLRKIIVSKKLPGPISDATLTYLIRKQEK